MELTLNDLLRMIPLFLLIFCAIGVNLTKSLLQAVIIFMSFSSVMCLIWIMLESPDLAITEAAVGAGVSGTLFLMTLRRIRAEDDYPPEEKIGSSEEVTADGED